MPFLQAATASAQANAGPVTATFVSSPTNGNTLFASIYTNGGVTVTSISQTGVTWVQDNTVTSTVNTISVWRASNVQGAGTGVQVNFSGTGVGCVIIVEEWSQIAIPSPLDQKASNNGIASTSVDTGTTPTTTHSTELAWGAMAQVGTGTASFSAATNGFTIQTTKDQSITGSAVTVNRIFTTPATADCTVTSTASAAWLGTMQTYLIADDMGWLLNKPLMFFPQYNFITGWSIVDSPPVTVVADSMEWFFPNQQLVAKKPTQPQNTYDLTVTAVAATENMTWYTPMPAIPPKKPILTNPFVDFGLTQGKNDSMGWSVAPPLRLVANKPIQPQNTYDLTVTVQAATDNMTWFTPPFNPPAKQAKQIPYTEFGTNVGKNPSDFSWWVTPQLRPPAKKPDLMHPWIDFGIASGKAITDKLEWFYQPFRPPARKPDLLHPFVEFGLGSGVVIVTDNFTWYVAPALRPPARRAEPIRTPGFDVSIQDNVSWYTPVIIPPRIRYFPAQQPMWDVSTGRAPFVKPRPVQADAPAGMNLVSYGQKGFVQTKKSSGSFKKGQGAMPQLQGYGIGLVNQAGTRMTIKTHVDTGIPVGNVTQQGQALSAATWAPQTEAIKFVPQTISSTYNANAQYTLLFADATNGAFTIYLPKAAKLPGGILMEIKKIDSSANHVTIAAFSGETIDGASTFVLASQYKYVRIISGAPASPKTWFVYGSN